jgi:uncharacterized protein
MIKVINLQRKRTATVKGSNTQNLILGGGTYMDTKSGKINHVLAVVDLESRKQTQADTSFLPHGIHRKPTDPNCLAVFEKIGPGACEFDLAARKVLRYIPVVDGRQFYGHGGYSIDGAVMYSTETILKSGDGVIAVRDSQTLKILGEFPTFGKEPHECKLIDAGRTMVVTNGGGHMQGDAPNVAYIDVNSEKLLEKVELRNARLNTGHISLSDRGSLVVVSAPRAGLGAQHLGGVSIRPRGQSMETADSQEAVTQRMQGEALSVAIHSEAGLAAVTHPDGDMVTIWSLHNRQLVKVIELEKARGVELTEDMQNFVISYGPKASLIKVPVATLEPDKKSMIETSFITGSHIYNWSRELSELYYPGPLV